MRKGVNGKQKGNAFEREICRRLSLWYTKGKRKDVFWRTATSGGRATVRLKKGEVLGAQAGDVGAVDATGAKFVSKYMVEVKHYKNLELESFVTQGKGLLMRFWQKLCKEALSYGKTPILIAKQNNRPILVFTAGPIQFAPTPRAIIKPSSETMDAHLFLFEDIFDERKRLDSRSASNRSARR